MRLTPRHLFKLYYSSSCAYYFESFGVLGCKPALAPSSSEIQLASDVAEPRPFWNCEIETNSAEVVLRNTEDDEILGLEFELE